jgi:hypothetical protein
MNTDIGFLKNDRIVQNKNDCIRDGHNHVQKKNDCVRGGHNHPPKKNDADTITLQKKMTAHNHNHVTDIYDIRVLPFFSGGGVRGGLGGFRGGG